MPSMVVKSGHGTHLYWRTREPYGCAGNHQRLLAHEAELRHIQAALAAYGADPAVCEAARVMRLPGFWNRKREPHQLVELTSSRPVHYTPSDPGRLPGSLGSQGQILLHRTLFRGTDEKSPRARAYAQKLAGQAPAISGKDGHRTTFQAAIKVACGFDLGEDEAFQVLSDAYNPACQPPWNPEDFGGRSRRPCESNRTGDGCWVQADMPCHPAGKGRRNRPPRLRRLAKPRLQRRGPQGRPGCAGWSTSRLPRIRVATGADGTEEEV